MFSLSRQRISAQAGFTLIEVLVVVAIISLLISILVPSLSKAKRQARKTVTLSHLRGLGAAMATYEVQNRGQHPALIDREEKAFLGLSLLARQDKLPPEYFINPNTPDSPAKVRTADRRLILADLAGAEIQNDTAIDSGSIARVRWHCSFSYDNDIKPRESRRILVYIGDRADYESGRTFSANWGREGMCLLWTDQHAEFRRSRALRDQADPNVYHHNEFGGEGGDEVVDGVKVGERILDTHLRFFSEEEDDTLLPG